MLTGSASMAAETAHSFADTLNQVFLLIALRGSAKPADRAHPFGYGRVRYFWALLAAGSIFVTGALYSAFEGVHALTSGEHDIASPLVNYVVLGVAFVLEGASLVRGLQQTRDEARQHRQSFRGFLRTSDDPTATTVVFEDSAALIGLLLAAAGNVLHQVTGHAFWDGIASLAIAVVLAAVALRLGLTNKRLLTDVQADPRLVRAVLRHLGDEPEVDAVVDLLTLQLGTDAVLVCARLDLADGLTSAEVERAMVRIGGGVEEAFPDVAEVFLEPVPRHDDDVRQRVRSRYGDRLAEYMVREASRP
ncbi:cation diffusion facilitator family transporter [Quadrisphaera granulorum]|uniref:Cation diffusion facilitator family transporter n=1 Tax=Quadrisphaera granulorum TaxID=317664 RepID=A0A315ZX97_9ACTN|nr:cation diffusion facilitator family transporter [Quadrisphaera granulorum]SZE98070.1 cation diffusion facilitator family transporter [Quadrisphaera granulorum]